VRVLEVGRQLDLGQKALRPDHGGQLRPEHLQRHLTVVADVLCQVDGGHATRTDLPVEPVAIDEGGLKTAEQFGHR
jgi:hypothetical protein